MPGSDSLSSAFQYEADLSFAQRMDAEDPLASYRDRFHIPLQPDGSPVIYLCGNSLGLQPKSTPDAMTQELDDWARLAVDAHFDGKNPWYPYHENFRETGARLVGAKPGEVVMMNSLTTNLHLMMVSFYRPTPERYKILIEDKAFPSDTYAVKSQLAFHGYDPEEGMIVVKPREGEYEIRTEDIEALLAEQGSQIATVMLGGVNYFSGAALRPEADHGGCPRPGLCCRLRSCARGGQCAATAPRLERRLRGLV